MTSYMNPYGECITPGFNDFEADCLHWRGRILLGSFAHWCIDWDDLPVDETCHEWPCVCEWED